MNDIGGAAGPGGPPAGRRKARTDEREREADQRELEADRREALADKREREADQRELEADRREALADKREREADQRAQDLQEWIRGIGEQSIAHIGRSRELVASSERQLRRQYARRRVAERHEREQEAAERELAARDRYVAAQQPDAADPITRLHLLRRRNVATIAVFATTEEKMAQMQEELAAANPDSREEFLRGAKISRTAARRAQSILRQLGGLPLPVASPEANLGKNA